VVEIARVSAAAVVVFGFDAVADQADPLWILCRDESEWVVEGAVVEVKRE
jgi:hypothetical protein